MSSVVLLFLLLNSNVFPSHAIFQMLDVFGCLCYAAELGTILAVWLCHSKTIMEFGDGLAELDLVLSMCERLYGMIMNMKGNKERRERLSQRVKALQTLIVTIKQSGPAHISEPILNALKGLKTLLACAEVMLIKYSQAKGIKSLVKSNSFEGKFQDMNERLNENYFTLSGALHAEHREALHQVHQTVSAGRMDLEPRSNLASSLVPLVHQPPTVTIPVPSQGLLSPVQPSFTPGHVVAPPPFFFPSPPVPTFTIAAPSHGIIVSPVSPIPSMQTKVVFSSTLSPPLTQVLRTYTIQQPFFSWHCVKTKCINRYTTFV